MRHHRTEGAANQVRAGVQPEEIQLPCRLALDYEILEAVRGAARAAEVAIRDDVPAGDAIVPEDAGL